MSLSTFTSKELDPQTYKIEPFDFYDRSEEVATHIEKFLRKLGLTSSQYFIKPYEYSCYVVINGDLTISDPRITKLPFKINRVNGNLSLVTGNLISLAKCPKYVEGYFDVSGNKLTSLGYFPKDVLGSIDISGNQIKKLTKSNGDPYLPSVIDGDFDCSNNKLTSLRGGPRLVTGTYDCSNNFLKNLDHKPQHSKLFIFGLRGLKTSKADS